MSCHWHSACGQGLKFIKIHELRQAQGVQARDQKPSGGYPLPSGKDPRSLSHQPQVKSLTLERTLGSGWTSPLAWELCTGKDKGKVGESCRLYPFCPWPSALSMLWC